MKGGRRAFCLAQAPNTRSFGAGRASLTHNLSSSRQAFLGVCNSRVNPTKVFLTDKKNGSSCRRTSTVSNKAQEGKMKADLYRSLLKRTHLCGKVIEADEDKPVSLCGWLTAVRDIGDFVFLVINDHSGSVQIVLDGEQRSKRLDEVNSWQMETVLSIQGVVKKRPEGMNNPLMKTGTIEVWANSVTCLNPVTHPAGLPFNSLKAIPQLQLEELLAQQQAQDPSNTIKKPADSVYALASEELRLKYRYLDLRRDLLQRNLRLRSAITLRARNHLSSEGFVEIETPTLFRSTPEGAREFLVPTRVKGKFFSLPQSPQQYKQLLMAGGFDRYFQFARCYRDEGLRSDRQPEFTQIDMEMAYVNPEDVRGTIERLLRAAWRAAAESKVGDRHFSSAEAKEKFLLEQIPPQLRDPKQSFPIMTYQEAMETYGSDKPDRRFDMKLNDVTHIFKDGNVGVLKVALEADTKSKSVGGGCIKAFVAKGMADISKEESEAIQTKAKDLGAKGVIEIKVKSDRWKSPIEKYMSATEKEKLKSELGFEEGDLVILSADANREKACQVLGGIRLLVANQMKKKGKLAIPDESSFNFLWVEDFPLFTPAFCEEKGKFILETTHHPFTAPWPDDLHLLEELVEKVKRKPEGEATFDSIEEIGKIPRGLHYDCVVNGVELGGGSIRVHTETMQRDVFRCLGMSNAVMGRFNHLLDALGLGCPPHGGIAIGFDRMMAVLCGAESLREVIAFPKTSTGSELMTGSPSEVTDKELLEYNIKVLQ